MGTLKFSAIASSHRLSQLIWFNPFIIQMRKWRLGERKWFVQILTVPEQQESLIKSASIYWSHTTSKILWEALGYRRAEVTEDTTVAHHLLLQIKFYWHTTRSLVMYCLLLFVCCRGMLNSYNRDYVSWEGWAYLGFWRPTSWYTMLEASTIFLGRQRPLGQQGRHSGSSLPLEEARAAILTSESLLENKHR